MKKVGDLTILVSVFLNLARHASSFSSNKMTMSISNDRKMIKNSSRRAFMTTTASVLPLYYGAYTSNAATNLPSTGIRAPEFELPNTEGATVNLDSLISNGKWTVLYFYPGAFTSGCTLEAKNFQSDLSSFQKLNTQIVGVSVDPVEKNAKFCQKEGLDFYMLTDEGGKVSKLYGSAISIPGFGSFSNRQTYIIDPKGVLSWVFVDVESRVARHSKEVLTKLNELQQSA